MSKRKDSQQIRHFLRDVDRELSKGLTLLDVCRKHGVGVRTYYRWRERYDPTVADDTRRAEELQGEVDRLKRLVAELMLDRQMLQDVAKKKW
jgi:putative transposase